MVDTSDARSLQDVLKTRQQEEFVGRGEELDTFRSNVELGPEDPRRRFIINVFGQGGVGKTWLLRQFRRVSDDAGYATGWSDEADEDLPSVMARIAADLEAAGQPLTRFSQRHQVYRDRRLELEADAEAPDALDARLTRVVTRGAIVAGRRIPVAGAVLDFVDEEAATDRVGEWEAYVKRKLGKRDEVQLILDPVGVLTPLFLSDLDGVVKRRGVALFFDTYERTGAFLDGWLRDLLDGRHGHVPANVVLVVGGRNELDRNLWSAYGVLLARISLDPFTADEGRDYLARRGIADQHLVQVILHLSGGLPLLVATLAAQRPEDPAGVGDPSGQAVERFLKWIADPRQRQVALDGALARRLNRDVLAQMVGDQPDAVYSWLKQMPFVEKRGHTRVYHDVVRTQMLRHKRQESPQGWSELHGVLAEFYEGQKDDMGLQDDAAYTDSAWQSYALEAVYHRLCQAPQADLSAALNGFLAALGAGRVFARRWAEAVQQAGVDSETAGVERWGRRLLKGLRAYSEGPLGSAAEMLTDLLNLAYIDHRPRAVALSWRGRIWSMMERYADALDDFDHAIALESASASSHAHRGITHRLMGQFEDAVSDLNSAIELRSDYAWAIVHRGDVYRRMRRYDDALADMDRALDLFPDYAWALLVRARTYRDVENHDQAIAGFLQAIEADPDLEHEARKELGSLYQALGEQEQAVIEFTGALAAAPICLEAWTGLGKAYQALYPPADVPRFLRETIVPGADGPDVIGCRGEAMRSLGYHNEALAELDRAFALVDADVRIIITRARIHHEMGHLEEELADLTCLIEIDRVDAHALVLRGQVLLALGRPEEAVADFDGAISMKVKAPGRAHLSRALAHQDAGRQEDALADYSRAIELDAELEHVGRKEIGLIHLSSGSYEDAAESFLRALAVQPGCAGCWCALARAYQAQDPAADVPQLLREAPVPDADGVRVIACRAEAMRATGHEQDAIMELDQAIARDPQEAVAIAIRGRAKLALARYAEALSDFDRAIELEPDEDWWLYLRALSHQLMGEPEKASGDFEIAIEKAAARSQKHPSDSPRTMSLALYYLATGQTEVAETACQRFLLDRPRMEEVGEAINDVSDLLALFPGNTGAQAVKDLMETYLRERQP